MSKTKEESLLGGSIGKLIIADELAESPATTAAPDPLRAELLELIRHELAEKQAKKAKEEAETLQYLRARSDGFKESEARRKAGQSSCPHRKEDNKPRIGGQRTSDGHITFICLYCFKTWDETTLPPTLQIGMENIGG